MTIGSLLGRTYAFVLMRLGVIILTLGGYLYLSVWVADYLVRLFGIAQAESTFVYYLFYINYLWIGASIGIALYTFVRKTLLFYVKSAHVIALTRLCTDDVPPTSLTLTAINDMRKRFLSVNIFYMADALVTKAMEEVGDILLQQEIPFLMDKNRDGVVSVEEKKIFQGNIILKVVSSVVRKALSYSDELILSHVFLRGRMEESFGEIEAHKGLSKSKKTLCWVADGIGLYFRNCVALAKRSFTLVVSVTVFGYVVAILSLVLLWLFQVPFVTSAVIFFAVRIIWVIVEYVLLEPYELAGMMLSFYEVMSSEPEDTALDGVKSYLVGKSKHFKNLIELATGNVVSGGGSTSLGELNAKSLIRDAVTDVTGIKNVESKKGDE